MSLIACMKCNKIYDNEKHDRCPVCKSFMYRPIDVEMDKDEIQGKERMV